MNALPFTFCGERLLALSSGALHWPAGGLLGVADLHFGKVERRARRDGVLLPPYELAETLDRLAADIAAADPETVVCLGDSFDDQEAARQVEPLLSERLAGPMAGRRWIWIAGNHDPGPVGLGGTHLARLEAGPFRFTHIADPETADAGEISGHYHPKARLNLRGRVLRRRCFLFDSRRLILPAYGTYTGGLDCDDPAFDGLFGPEAAAVLLGHAPVRVPMPRGRPVQSASPARRRSSR